MLNSFDFDQPSATVLLVDPDRSIRTSVKVQLEKGNCRVLEADCGRAAKSLAAQTRSIDVLLTDVRMPVITGPALAQTLRQQFPHLKVVYMSDLGPERLLSQPRTRQQSFGFVQKPFAPDALADWVRGITTSTDEWPCSESYEDI